MNADNKPPVQLKRTLSLTDLVLFNVVAVASITSLAATAVVGTTGLSLFIIAAIFFFIPEGLAVNELSSSFPKEGGIYAWTKTLLGKGHGFLCGWCYWVNNLLYYPLLILTIVKIAVYVFPGSPLFSRTEYILPLTLLILWTACILNMIGMKRGKWLQNVGGIGTYVPFIILVVVAGITLSSQQPANSFSATEWKLHLNDFSYLNLWAIVPFAYTGLELSASMGDEIKDPHKNLRRAVFIAAPLIALFYILGTTSILYVVPKSDIDVIGGAFQAITKGLSYSGSGIQWLAILAAACAIIGRMGGLGAWITGAARVAFVVGVDNYLPRGFARIHSRWHTPYVALIVQTVVATIFLVAAILGRGTTIETAFFILLDACIIIYFIPYCYLFICYVLNYFRNVHPRTRAKTIIHVAAGVSGLLITVFGMIVAMIPAPGTDAFVFEVKVIGGCAAILLIGGCFYWLAGPEKK